MLVAMLMLIGLVALAVIASGFWTDAGEWDPETAEGRLGRLKRRRDSFLRAIKDLEAEREAGTLADEEFFRLRHDYKRRAIRVSKELARARQRRLRQLSSARAGEAGSEKQRIAQVEKLVRERLKNAPAVILVLAGVFVAAACFPVGASAEVILKGKVFDAEASHPGFMKRVREGDMPEPADGVPFTGKPLTVRLVDGHFGPQRGRQLQEWKVETGADGSFELSTARESIPASAFFVVGAGEGSEAIYSRGFRPGEETRLFLYKTTDDASGLRPRIEIIFDYDKTATGDYVLIVDVKLWILNSRAVMYVGRKSGSSWRRVYRLPVPEDATIHENAGPANEFGGPPGGLGGWTRSDDGYWLVLDTPVAGVMETPFEDYFQSAPAGAWRVRYSVPARQSMTFSFPLDLSFGAREFTVWCVKDDMSVSSPVLGNRAAVKHPRAPVHKERVFEVILSEQRTLESGQLVPVALTVDNAAIGQVSLGAVRWVGGALLGCLIALLLGIGLSARRPPADRLFDELSGEEVLDRIADLDRRRREGRIKEKLYQRYRQALVRVAAEELALDVPGGSGGGPARPAAAAGNTNGLPPEIEAILARIDAIEASENRDPGAISERAHLLEALAKELRRGRGAPPRPSGES